MNDIESPDKPPLVCKSRFLLPVVDGSGKPLSPKLRRAVSMVFIELMDGYAVEPGTTEGSYRDSGGRILQDTSIARVVAANWENLEQLTYFLGHYVAAWLHQDRLHSELPSGSMTTLAKVR